MRASGRRNLVLECGFSSREPRYPIFNYLYGYSQACPDFFDSTHQFAKNYVIFYCVYAVFSKTEVAGDEAEGSRDYLCEHQKTENHYCLPAQ